MKARSKLTGVWPYDHFGDFATQSGIDGIVREYRFAPPRRWRFDFAHLPSRVAIELEGGIWVGGRHNRASSFEADAEKYNTAAALGWRLVRLTPGMLRSDPARWIAMVGAAIAQRENIG